ncbi:PhzF family isomerase [Companilactobacillus kimchiensis]|uniref:Epimerase n=1 Tax=Companilactobacillus kimchiensis TaxID=993692 RepID=A0A0R2LDH5_9LACO|nr:PhzF family isomerase [Companilactobacillus kimchiensis]KRN97989.1 epimerase [Companilactobacillus kimchiensis]
MKKYRIYQVDAFTQTKLAGNPAGVITNADGLTAIQMQQIARELNNSETAFIVRPTTSDADIRIRFFTPTMEVPICGHATIGANFARAIENNLDSQTIIQQTGAGNLPIDILKKADTYQITMTQGKIRVDQPLSDNIQNKILSALGITAQQRNSNYPMAIASTGAPKVMIALDNQETLNNLEPDLEALKAITPEINCNGYFVFTMNPSQKDLIHGRMFSPANGINEDPVTGNANGPLGAYLVKYGLIETQGNILEFNVIQGEKINRTGTMLVRVHLDNGQPVKIQIVGNAVIAFSTTLEM